MQERWMFKSYRKGGEKNKDPLAESSEGLFPYVNKQKKVMDPLPIIGLVQVLPKQTKLRREK
jgi:hypothetical protein